MAVEAPDRPKRGVAIILQDGFKTEQLTAWSDDLPIDRRKPGLLALAVLVGVLGFGGLWASTAQIGGAISATGRLVAEGQNIVVQHLDGGILNSISVREGDNVVAGEVLATLDSNPFESQFRAAKVQQALLTIELERWRATARQSQSFDLDLAQFGDVAGEPRVVETLQSQRDEFNAARDVLIRQLAQLDATIESERKDIETANALLKSYAEQTTVVETELNGLRDLFAQGLTTRVRLSTLERTLSQLESQVTDAEGAVTKSELNISAAEERKQALIFEDVQEASQSVSRVQGLLNDQADLVFRLDDRITRSTIKAPIDGIVVRVNNQSVGAVLQAAQTFVEIFPKDGAMSIETRLDPRNIGEIKLDQDVDITFLSDGNRTLVPLKGKVTYVSQDSFVPPEGGAPYYVVRSTINPGQADRPIVPGNSAEVYFKTEPKTFLQYITEPITRFAMRSFPG
jgi:HlyD family type I secretion membrane fusion protein